MSVEPSSDKQDLVSRALRRQVRLPEFSQPVYIEEIEEIEGELLLSVRTRDGQTEQIIASRNSLAEAITQAEKQDVTDRQISPLDFFLLVEAARIRLAYSFDPFFAVSMSGVQALPHQLQAVYERMLPQARLRFLLADDPGAGKTIMAGLLLKELKLRGVINYVLILTPAPLTIQWQDELYTKFDETFEIINSSMVGNRLAGNVWDHHRQCIASLDFAKQHEIAQTLEQVPWDLIIIDEAHKCAARTQGEKTVKTRRYQLAEQLSVRAERILLLTATPHSGDPSQFAHFLRLLDADQFPDPRFDGLALDQKIMADAREGGRDQWFLRRIKEELRDQVGNPLFTRRHAVTVPFSLTYAEERLYKNVTEYINRFLPYQQGGSARRHSVALARTVLQRRLASSLHAIFRSLERRATRFEAILKELDNTPQSKHEEILQKYRLLANSGYEEDNESEGDDLDEMQDEALETFPVVQRVDDLRREVKALQTLVKEARGVMELGEESKLKALRKCMDRAQFKELQDGRGKLLIFTEHRDTLEYLRDNLQKWGYTTCEIHGGMKAIARREAAQRFQESAQVCIATEAAGEGINLQFCHLMINYDIPWNPNRLEQRMGRIHRIGQRSDVYIFNFVSTDTVEGGILQRLFVKLEEIQGQLGDRVFDVVGQLLMLNDIRLEEMLREAAMNPARLEEYTDQIEQLSVVQLTNLEEATGVALATSQVDLSWVRGADTLSQERRLMPEYVEKFFLRAAEREQVLVRRRADGLHTIEHVPARLRSPQLSTARRYGLPHQEYRKLTFHKEVQQRPEHLDSVLLSPGHPLFAALTEVLQEDLKEVQGQAAFFVDPRASEGYSVHFFEIQIVSEEPNAEIQLHNRVAPTQVLYSTLAAIIERPEGRELVSADLLHDLTPLPEGAQIYPECHLVPPEPEEIVKLGQWVRVKVQFHLKKEQSRERQRLLTIRREYLEHMFAEQIRRLQHSYLKLAKRVREGDDAAKLARDDADRRQKELKRRRVEKLAELDRLQVVREGAIHYMGTALVAPITQTSLANTLEKEDHIDVGKLVRDDEIERIGMDYVMEYERARGWQPEDISKNHDGSGFDIRSSDPRTGAIRRIEVKSRAQEGEFVELTPNEWLQARRHGESYWLYIVWNCATKPHLIMIQDPAQKLAHVVQQQIVIEGYRVPGGAIQELQTQVPPANIPERP